MNLEKCLTLSKDDLIFEIEKIKGIKTKSMSWLLQNKPALTNPSVCFVSHIDTYNDVLYEYNNKLIYHDEKRGVYWSPGGLGADDRAGVYACLQMYHQFFHSNYPISILFCDYEENGGQGAKQSCQSFKNELSNVLFFIEFDRQEKNDCVFYNNESNHFKKWIESFGFYESIGSFSDISILGKFFKKVSVNLSTGFFNEHSEAEYLIELYLLDTIKKASEILKMYKEFDKKWKINPMLKKWDLKSFYH